MLRAILEVSCIGFHPGWIPMLYTTTKIGLYHHSFTAAHCMVRPILAVFSMGLDGWIQLPNLTMPNQCIYLRSILVRLGLVWFNKVIRSEDQVLEEHLNYYLVIFKRQECIFWRHRLKYFLGHVKCTLSGEILKIFGWKIWPLKVQVPYIGACTLSGDRFSPLNRSTA